MSPGNGRGSRYPERLPGRHAPTERQATRGLLTTLDVDLDAGGRVVELAVAQADAEQKALELVREHALRALDAWHLAVASLTLPALAAPENEEIGFASRDDDQATVAEALGFTRV